MPLMEKFFEIFPKEFNMIFYGVDIIVDSVTGVHYFVDCNYLANYNSIPQNELIAAVDRIINDHAGSNLMRIAIPAVVLGLVGAAAYLFFKRERK